MLASMIHLLGSRPRSRQPEVNFELLVRTGKWLSSADVEPEIIRAVFPVIVFEVSHLLSPFCTPLAPSPTTNYFGMPT
ncbi:unnamed protein product [Dibothriocephalus latus]|uniref:Uncharacterized protein n=1 Tax=Dibothriocephalus latus TaxID=60516 RepID=A0A3P6PQP7_DIBLA|nr:unnamed protein product [Dibothriocephalus latus]